jgi:OFA family oxalate/formate antiporter-like MFS transporter
MKRASWLTLVPCVVAIMAVANLQYTWTLFVQPLMNGFGAKLSAVQLGFTLYIVAQTWLAPVEGYLADRFKARPLAALGGLMVGANWIGAGTAHSLAALYASCLVGGFGCGLVMSVCGRIALRSFPGRSGLAIGVVSMAYGLGPVLAVLPIQHTIESHGYRWAFVFWGFIQAALTLAAAWFLRDLDREEAPSAASRAPLSMIATYPFALMYLIMILVCFGGLLITAQLAPMAKSFGIGADAVVLGVAAVSLAIMLDRITNAAARPFWGGLSDRIGRCEAMAAAFACEAAAVFLLIHTSGHPLAFVLVSGAAFFAWGEIFSLFPALIADVFGPEYAMANYGVLFTAKGTASLFAGWGAAYMFELHASWTQLLWLAVACDVLAAGLAYFCLRPAAAVRLSSAG